MLGEQDRAPGRAIPGSWRLISGLLEAHFRAPGGSFPGSGRVIYPMISGFFGFWRSFLALRGSPR